MTTIERHLDWSEERDETNDWLFVCITELAPGSRREWPPLKHHATTSGDQVTQGGELFHDIKSASGSEQYAT